MNEYTYAAFTNVALIILAGYGMYITQTIWPLLALLALKSIVDDDDVTKYGEFK